MLTVTNLNALGTSTVTLAGGTLSLQTTASGGGGGGGQQTVAVTGFNIDAVWAGAEANPQAGTTGMFLSGYVMDGAPNGGLPSSGTLAHAGVTFQLQPYVAANNVLTFGNTTGILTLTSPGKFQAIELLAGPRDFYLGPGSTWNYTATLNFSDGSSSPYALTMPQAYNNSDPSVVINCQESARARVLSPATVRACPCRYRRLRFPAPIRPRPWIRFH